MEVQIACKEWASVCAALASGRQSILLRKGGISEPTGDFRVQSNWFWLYPTFVHQKQNPLREFEWFEKGEAFKAPFGKVFFFHIAEVVEIINLTNPDLLEKIEPFHVLNRECVYSRFSYRSPGLTIVLARIYKIQEPMEIDETPFYSGCKSWVNLIAPLNANSLSPVIPNNDFHSEVVKIKTILNS